MKAHEVLREIRAAIEREGGEYLGAVRNGRGNGHIKVRFRPWRGSALSRFVVASQSPGDVRGVVNVCMEARRIIRRLREEQKGEASSCRTKASGR